MAAKEVVPLPYDVKGKAFLALVATSPFAFISCLLFFDEFSSYALA